MREELIRILKDLVYATGGNSGGFEETEGIERAIVKIERLYN